VGRISRGGLAFAEVAMLRVKYERGEKDAGLGTWSCGTLMCAKRRLRSGEAKLMQISGSGERNKA